MTHQIDMNSSLSNLYHALRATRRRQVIELLSDSDTQSHTTRELAREIAGIEEEVAVHQATGEPYRNAYNALSQTHLPTLSEAGIVIYDPKRQTVCPGTRLNLAALLIDTNTSTVGLVSSLLEYEPEV